MWLKFFFVTRFSRSCCFSSSATRYYNGAAAFDGGVKVERAVNGGAFGGGSGAVAWVMGRLPAPVAARINVAMLKGRTVLDSSVCKVNGRRLQQEDEKVVQNQNF